MPGWCAGAPGVVSLPAPSWPGMKGRPGFTGQSPRAAWMSVWQTPLAFTSTSTSPGPGVGIGTSWMVKG